MCYWRLNSKIIADQIMQKIQCNQNRKFKTVCSVLVVSQWFSSQGSNENNYTLIMVSNLIQGQVSWGIITLIIVIIGVSYFVYSRIIKPYRLFSLYRSLISAHYKVLVDPFNPFYPHLLTRVRNDLQKHGDSIYTVKNQFKKYQLVLSMFRASIYLELIDPELVRQYFEKTNQGYYRKSLNSQTMNSFKFVVGTGLLFSQGNQWKMKRKIMTTVFNYDFIKSKISTISQIANQVFDKIEGNKGNKGQKEIKMDLGSAFQEISGNVVIKCFFGNIKLQEIQGQNVFSYFNRLIQLNIQRSYTRYALFIGPKFLHINLRPIDRLVNKMKRQFNNYAENAINQHLRNQSTNNSQKEGQKESTESKGVIHLLIKSQKLRNPKEGSQNLEDRDFYTTQDLIDQFKSFFFAGTDSTTNLLTNFIYALVKAKQVMQKLRQQIRQVFGDGEAEITYQKLKQMKYLQKSIKEVLRINTSVIGIFNRQAVKDHCLGKIPIKAGTVFTVSITSNNYKESLSMNPQIFNPDRWDTIDLKKKDPYSFFPFSAGQRNCIGQHLAMIEIKIIVINLLKRYKSIIMQKAQFRQLIKGTYGPQRMVTTFIK